MDDVQFQKLLMEKALAAGFSDCEIYYQKSHSFGVTILEGEVSDYESSDLQGVCFRGTYADTTGYAYTERLTEADIDMLIQEAKENALLLSSEERETLYPPEAVYPNVDTENIALEHLTPEEKIHAAKKMESAALQCEKKIASMDYCSLSTLWRETAILNSHGLCLRHRKNHAMAYICAIAKDGNDIKTGSHFWKGNCFQAFDPVATGKKAAEIAVSHLGAKSIPAGNYATVLDGNVVADLLRTFCGIFFAENTQKGFSLLNGKEGEKIASSLVTIEDLPLLAGGYASTPFDSEGVACYNKAIIQNGILKTLLYNRKTAAKDGTASTGNGFKPSLSAPVQTSVTNFYLQTGNLSQEQLLQQMQTGLLITDITGLHAGANTVSGDFSLSAEGFWIAEGKKAYPVEQITIAGNFYTLLQNISALGNDLYVSPSGVGAPSVSLPTLSISGQEKQ